MQFPLLKENNIKIESVLDIGAHSGLFTVECKKYFPDAYYYLIDGNPLLIEHVKDIGVDYKICYLSDSIKDTVVYKTKHSPHCTGDSLYRENTQWYNDERVIIEPIKTSTLDEVFNNKKIFDFIKIDTQGSELDIVKGGLEMCKKAKVLLLEVSVWPYNINAPLFDEVKEFMKSIGFPYSRIVSNMHYPDNVLIQHDVYFTKVELV